MKRTVYLTAALGIAMTLATVSSAGAITRAEIVSRAQRWVTLEVPYSQTSHFESYRQDCSGMTSMAWRLDQSYSTRTLAPSGVVIGRDELQPGDMLLKYDYHAAIFEQWANADHTWYWALEQSGTRGHAVRRLTMYPYWSHAGFSAYRHKSIDEVDDYADHVLEVAGPERYSTALAASRLAFEAGSATCAVICSGATWPDALGGSALAGALGGPVLLVAPNAVPSQLPAELARLGVTDVTIVGGTGAVSEGVAGALDALPNVSVRRIGGVDRYQTAALVASATIAARGGVTTETPAPPVYLATGTDFADALGASAVAAYTGSPVLLSRPETLSPSAAQFVTGASISQVYVAGGTGALSTTVTAGLAELGVDDVQRFAGINRYATSLLLAKHGVELGLAWDDVAIATGTGFADALAGGVMQARRGSVLVLTPPDRLAPAPDWAVRENGDAIERVTVLGGTGAVKPIVRRQVRWILDPP